MNRLLVIPLLACVLLFAVVFQDRSQDSPSGERSGAAAATLASSDHLTSSDLRGDHHGLMPLEEARREILEPWPEESIEERFSRRETFLSLSAWLSPPDEVSVKQSPTRFLCSLSVDYHATDLDSAAILNATLANPLPIYVDRRSREIFVFYDSRWHEYHDWIGTYQPDIKKMTGFGTW
ncbi:hypothetical protein [Roseiconus lacunae]|uniref:hypothetical protein n=1 Tax=Roseiconus lacunae TaxID=2605694 RepID=UPI0011F1CF7E|nr:hypothetical protein [Roseiconus lacunae]